MQKRQFVYDSKNDTTNKISFPLKLLWQVNFSPAHGYKDGVRVSDPLYMSRKLYFITVRNSFDARRTLHAFDAGTGKEIWSYVFEKSKYFLNTNDYCLYKNTVLTDDGQSALLLFENGEIKQRFDGLGGWMGAPAIYRDTLIISRLDGIYFIRLPDMTILNKFEADRPYTAACFEDKVIFADRADKTVLKCADIFSGRILWQNPVYKTGAYTIVEGTGTGKKVIPKLGTFYSRFPVIDDGKIFCSLGKFFCGFDLETGELLWRTANAFLRDAVYHNGKLYFFEGEYFICLDAESGKNDYEISCGEGISTCSRPFLAGTILFAGNIDGLYAFDIKAGKVVWKYKEQRGFTPQPLFVDGKLYAGIFNLPGSMCCFASA